METLLKKVSNKCNYYLYKSQYMEDKLSITLRKNVYFIVKYIQNMSLKKLHQLSIMDNTILHKTQRHVFQITCILTWAESKIMTFLVPV